MYTIISYIGTIATPLVNLPSIIVKILQYRDVFYRIDNFFKADDIIAIRDFYLENGTIHIDRPVFSLGTIASISRILVK